jgi:hypothetical protein
MVKITEVDPDKKYVLSITEPMPDAEVVHLRERFDELLRQDGVNIIIISGVEITLIPADQVVGYISFE